MHSNTGEHSPGMWAAEGRGQGEARPRPPSPDDDATVMEDVARGTHLLHLTVTNTTSTCYTR